MPQENQFFHKALSQGEEEELARRRARFTIPENKRRQACESPYLRRYAQSVSSVWKGAVLEEEEEP